MNNKIDMIFFGDSLTYGYGVDKTECWVYKLSKELGLSFFNKAKNGDTSCGMLTRYYNDVLIYNPSRIFLMAGTNDLLSKRTVKSIIDNIEIMIKDALNINSEIIVGLPPKIIGDLANELFMSSDYYSYAENELKSLKYSLIDLCKKYNIKYIDFYDLPLNKSLFLDGLHLTNKGHDLMFNEALDIFKIKKPPLYTTHLK